MSDLKISETLSLPIDAVTQTVLDIGKRGSGKSTTAARLVEQIAKQGVPFVVLDPADAWCLTGTQQRILDMIATLDLRGVAVDRISLARWFGLHPNGGRFLRDLAVVRREGYLSSTGFSLTAGGAFVARPGATGAEEVLATLGAHKEGGTRLAMMRAILDRGPAGFPSRVELAAALGLHPNGGRFLRNLARLRQMGVVPDRGEVRAAETVFR